MTHWPLVSADLQETFGVAEYQHEAAPWPWLRTLILDLPTNPNTRVFRALTHS